jgi:hypothetical protein
MTGRFLSRPASKVNVEIADPSYLPADAAFKNLEEPRDDVLLVVAARHRRRAIPAVSSIVRVRWRGNVLPASFISPSSAIGKHLHDRMSPPIPAAS